MQKKIRWGIIGTGTIANYFAGDSLLVENSILEAVASRSIKKSEEFAEKYSINKAYGSYEELANDPNIDAIYIATPHVFHKENTLMCLKNKKAVLCEKPLSVNSRDVKEMIDCAKENKVFLMEAMWTRFLPISKYVNNIIDSGEIGEIRLIKADFGFNIPNEYPITGRLLNKSLGGGSLLDVGIYPIAFTNMIMKKNPQNITSNLIMGKTEVDLTTIVTFEYENSASAILYSSICANTEQSAYISGTKGTIHIPFFWMADEVTIEKENGEVINRKIPKKGLGYSYEIEAVNNYLNEEKLESDIITLEESYEIMKLIDKIRTIK